MEAFIKLIPILITIILSTIGYIVWLVRMEAKVKAHAKDITELKLNQKEESKELKVKIDSMNDKLTELIVNFADFTGYMRRCNEEKNERPHP
jgi:flagellar basal body-associated protein FliL